MTQGETVRKSVRNFVTVTTAVAALTIGTSGIAQAKPEAGSPAPAFSQTIVNATSGMIEVTDLYGQNYWLLPQESSKGLLDHADQFKLVEVDASNHLVNKQRCSRVAISHGSEPGIYFTDDLYAPGWHVVKAAVNGSTVVVWDSNRCPD